MIIKSILLLLWSFVTQNGNELHLSSQVYLMTYFLYLRHICCLYMKRFHVLKKKQTIHNVDYVMAFPRSFVIHMGMLNSLDDRYPMT